MLLAWNIGRGWSSQFLGLRRRSILCLRLRRILGYFLFTRNGLLWVVAVLITHAFQPPLTAISSFLFKRHEKIALDEGLSSKSDMQLKVLGRPNLFLAKVRHW